MRVASIDSCCDGCKRKWVAQMHQGGHILHLCANHANELLYMRGSGKNTQKADMWARRLGTKSQDDPIPDDAIAVSDRDISDALAFIG